MEKSRKKSKAFELDGQKLKSKLISYERELELTLMI